MDRWPALREAIMAEQDAERLTELQDELAALAAPLDDALVTLATDESFEVQQLIEVLLFRRADDVAESALRLLGGPSEGERKVAVRLLHRLIPMMGAARHASETQVTLPPTAKGVLLEALHHGVDDYVVSQLLVRQGWALEESLPALRAAVSAALMEDAEHEGAAIGYDLGCDLQNVAVSLMHAGPEARGEIALLARLHDGGDNPLRTVVTQVVATIGGADARALVTMWSEALDEEIARADDEHLTFMLGERAELMAASCRLEARGALETMNALLPFAAKSFFAEMTLAREAERFPQETPEIERIMRARLRDDDVEVARVARSLLVELGFLPTPPHARRSCPPRAA